MTSSNITLFNVNVEDHSSEKNYYFIEQTKKANPLANPFKCNGKKTSVAKLTFKTREEAVLAYRKYFAAAYNTPGYEQFTNAFNDLYKHYKQGEKIYLGCMCPPEESHGVVIIEELRKKLIKEQLIKKRIVL